MKIGIFGDQRFLYDGNGNYFTKGNLRKVLLEEYAKHFDKIYLFFRTKQSDISWAPPQDIIHHDKIEFIHLPTFEGPLGFAIHKHRIKNIIEENIDKCDVCILRFCYRVSCVAAPIALRHNKPTIAHLRGYGHECMMYDIERIPFWPARKIMAYINWKTNSKAVQSCDRIVGTSKAVADEYAQAGRQTMGVADGCTTEDFFIPFRARSPRQPANIILVARINYAKNVQQAVRAVAKVRSRGLDCVFTIVGDGPYLHRIKELAAKLGISDIMRFPGRVNSRQELLNYYRQAHIGILTSLSEGLPSSIIESMAASLPVVCTNLPCMREIVNQGRNGFLVEIGDVDSCAENLALLISDESLRQKMGQNAYNVALEYRTDKQVSKLVRLVKELAEIPKNERRK